MSRCQVDASLQWHMVCGACWKTVSGGSIDGSPTHPHYRYGGLWKNHHADVTGKHRVPASAKAASAPASTAAAEAAGATAAPVSADSTSSHHSTESSGAKRAHEHAELLQLLKEEDEACEADDASSTGSESSEHA